MTMSTSVTQPTEIRASGQLSAGAPSTCSPAPSSASRSASPTGPGASPTQAPSSAVSAGFPPLGALFAWPWLVAGIVGMLIIRRPGAAVFTELLAAIVSALIGTQWGLTTLVSGLVQGLGVELGFAAFGYARLPLGTAAPRRLPRRRVRGGLRVVLVLDRLGLGLQVAYLFLLGGSVAIFGSLLAVALTWVLAQAGALNAFPPGQEARERHAV